MKYRKKEGGDHKTPSSAECAARHIVRFAGGSNCHVLRLIDWGFPGSTPTRLHAPRPLHLKDVNPMQPYWTSNEIPDLTNKHAVVTGAGRELGQLIIKRLSEH